MVGIYQIRNTANNHIYIGSSNNTEKRWKNHLASLRNDHHDSAYLQNAWNKYGESNFVCELLEEVPESELFVVEQRYLDERKPEYNVSLYATAPMRGRHHTKENKLKLAEYGKIHMTKEKIEKMHKALWKDHIYKTKRTKEEKSKIYSDAAKKRWADPKYREKHSGYVRTDKHRKDASDRSKKMWKAGCAFEYDGTSRRGQNAKHTIEQIKEIRRLHEEGLTARQLAERTGDTYRTIRSILYDNWKWV